MATTALQPPAMQKNTWYGSDSSVNRMIDHPASVFFYLRTPFHATVTDKPQQFSLHIRRQSGLQGHEPDT